MRTGLRAWVGGVGLLGLWVGYSPPFLLMHASDPPLLGYPSPPLTLQAGELASQLHSACEKQYLASMGLLIHITRHCNPIVRSYWQ